MRIWSKKLIPVLPNKQLKAMRYELGDMIKQYPNIKNPLVKFANNYSCNYLLHYFSLVCMQCAERQINMNYKYNVEIENIATEKSWEGNPALAIHNIFFNEDDNRYLKQCLYNLQEKYDRGIITEKEWEKVLEGVIKDEC